MQNLQVKSLSKKFQSLQVIRDLTMEFAPGQIHCLFGPSGCGKTTFLQLVCGLLAPDGGKIQGVADSAFSYVFQEERLLPWATVKENILFVLRSLGLTDQEAEERTEKYLALVGLDQFEHYYPGQLSGGMKQRAAIARAFAYGGNILILDEPFKGLDFERKKSLMDYVLTYLSRDSEKDINKDSSKEKPLCFFVTHDVEEALYLADVIHVFTGPPLTLTSQLTIDTPPGERTREAGKMEQYRKLLLTQSTDSK